MKILVDTCVIIDILQKREPFFEDSYELLKNIAVGKIKAYISAKSIADIYYLMHKFFHDKDKTKEALLKICSLFDILDTKKEDCKRALLNDISDYEDAIMIETAISNNINYIITRNIKDFTTEKVKIKTPKEFNKLI